MGRKQILGLLATGLAVELLAPMLPRAYADDVGTYIKNAASDTGTAAKNAASDVGTTAKKAARTGKKGVRHVTGNDSATKDASDKVQDRKDDAENAAQKAKNETGK